VLKAAQGGIFILTSMVWWLLDKLQIWLALENFLLGKVWKSKIAIFMASSKNTFGWAGCTFFPLFVVFIVREGLILSLEALVGPPLPYPRSCPTSGSSSGQIGPLCFAGSFYTPRWC
jgi:hypothetical protein